MTNNSNRFLRLNAVLDKTGLSRSTLYRKIEEGTFPKQITIGARCVAWLESEIEEWMSNPMYYEASDRAGRVFSTITADTIVRVSSEGVPKAGRC